MKTLNVAIKTALCGAVVGIMPATGAWAQLSTTAVNAISAGNTIYVAGSTATDAAIQAFFADAVAGSTVAPCQAGTYTLLSDAASGSSSYAIACTASANFASGALTGQNILISKQTSGGSAIGIHNVAAGIAAANFVVTPCTALNACGISQTIVPNAGISDVDPTTVVGTGGVTSAEAQALTAANGVEVPFAPIVSYQLRNALQTAEGLTSGSETLANVPSLTPAQLRAIYSGQMLSLGDLYVFNPTTQATVQVDTSGSLVHICRRGNTSGTEFGANIYFFGSGCSKGSGVGTVSAPDNASTATAGETWSATAAQVADFVFAGSGTGDVKSCVSYATTAPGDTVAYRVGFVSTDQVPTAFTSGTNPWRYVAINGNAPTIWNIQLGKYDWITEDTFNSTSASLALNGGLGNHGTIFSGLRNGFANVESLAQLNAASQNAAALGTAGGAADTGIVTLGNSVLYGSSDPTGPSAPAWPAAIRLSTAGNGPNSPLSKTYPSSAVNNCNGAYQSDPTG